MKKAFGILLALCMVLLTAACAPSGNGSTAAPAPAPSGDGGSIAQSVASAAPAGGEVRDDGKQLIKFGFAHSNYENIVMRYINIRLTDEITKYNDDASNPYFIELMFSVADSDAAKQASQISNMISSNCDVIGLCAVDTTAVLASVQECNNAGIPILVWGIGLVESDIKPTCTVMCDVYDSGYQGTKAALAMMLADGYAPEDIKTICIVGALRDNNSLLYRDGSLAALAEIGAPEPLAFVESEWNAEICTQRLAPAMEANPETNFIICPNSDQVMACETVLSRIDRWHRRGEEGHIYMSANCSMPHALQYLCDGYLDADVTDIGNSIDILLDYVIKIADDKLDECVDTKVKLEAITRENFDQLKADGKFWSQPFWSKDMTPTWQA